MKPSKPTYEELLIGFSEFVSAVTYPNNSLRLPLLDSDFLKVRDDIGKAKDLVKRAMEWYTPPTPVEQPNNITTPEKDPLTYTYTNAGSRGVDVTPMNVVVPRERISNMRLNIYNEEITGEVELVQKTADTGTTFYGVRVFLASPDDLHGPETGDDDRSAVTFWIDDQRRAMRLEGLLRAGLIGYAEREAEKKNNGD